MALRLRTRTDPATREPHLNAWRVSTAIRVFVLALASGSVLGASSPAGAAPLLTALALTAAMAALAEARLSPGASAWVPVVEGTLCAIVLAQASPQPDLLVYLAAPPTIAGLRAGWVHAAITSAATVIALAGTLTTAASSFDGDQLRDSVSWVVLGLGAGLLASWQSRSLRDLTARQAPHADAHQLMARIHRLATSGTLGLDSATLASELVTAMRQTVGAARATVFVVDPDGTLRPLAGGDDVDRLRQEIELSEADRTPGAAVVPLRGARDVLGYCVLVGVPRWTAELDRQALEVADEFALRLDTAVLFDNVRVLATSEERNRIAREMHDGVAQEIVGLGYLVDEIESISDQEPTRELAAALRTEITRLVSEIRFSIFDLRHEVTDGRLSSSLADYAREVSHATGLRVHLSLSESGPPLPSRTATEVLRVAQEAISNVRKHARARNLWVTYGFDGSSLVLRVEDDGVGNAGPKDNHWGLQTMRERAAGVGALFEVTARNDGGTVVSLRSPTTTTPEGETAHGHHRATG
jgi:signal transduction histidine kinase